MNLAQQLKEECQGLNKESQEAFKHLYLEEIKPIIISSFHKGNSMSCYLSDKLVEKYGIGKAIFKALCEAEGFSCEVFTERGSNGNTNYLVTVES